MLANASLTCMRVGRLVILVGALGRGARQEDQVIFNVPSGYRPMYDIYLACSSGGASGALRIAKDGSCTVWNNPPITTDSARMYFNAVYVTS